jgi:hypothetical protein
MPARIAGSGIWAYPSTRAWRVIGGVGPEIGHGLELDAPAVRLLGGLLLHGDLVG